MAYRVELTLRAQRDLSELYDYIHAESVPAAGKWYAGLKRTILSLERLPDRGEAVRPRARIRRLLYGNKPHIYAVLYRVNKRLKQVDVLHIRHGARDEYTSGDLG